MERYELPTLNKPGAAGTPITPAPGYDLRTDNHTAGVARNHYYQMPVEVPRTKPWYRRKACVTSSVIVGIILLIAAIAVGLALVFIVKDRNDDEDKGQTATVSLPAGPTATKQEPSTMTVTSRTTLTPSIHTVTLTKSAEESEEPSTIIQTITASEPEDVAGVISSLLTRYPYYTTELTTETRTISNTIEQTLTREVTFSEEPEPEPTTEVFLTTQVVTLSNTVERTMTSEVTITEEEEQPASTREPRISLVTITRVSEGPEATKYEPTTILKTVDSPSQGSDNSEDSSNKSTEETSEPSIATIRTQPLSTSSSTASVTSSATSTPTSSSFNTTTISKNSNFAAVDVVNAPASLQRRLIIWQDEEDNLVVRDSSDGDTAVTHIGAFIPELPKGKMGTPLAAAADDKGQVHIFYITNDSETHHISQQDLDQWTDKGTPKSSIPASSKLAAVWHESSNDTKLLTLTLIYDWRGEKSDKPTSTDIFFSADYGDSWDYVQPDAFKNITVPAEGECGFSVVSGIAWSDDGDDMEEPQAGEYAGLHVMTEGEENIQLVECEFEGNSFTGCYVVDRQFHICKSCSIKT